MPEPLSRGGEEFLLRVKGDSMINAGILEGDFVVVRADAGRARTARSSWRSPATTRPPRRRPSSASSARDGRVRLQPENDTLEPIYAQHVQLLGRVIGVFRSL